MVLHHLGIVVDHLDEAAPLFEVWMGGRRVGGAFEDEYQGARIQLFLLPNEILLEVIEPLPGRGTPFHKTGEFHLCFTVPDLDAEMERLHHLGAVVTHPSATAPLFESRRIGFLVSHSAQLLELLEEAKTPVQ